MDTGTKSFETYLRDIGKIPLLTAEQERELVIKAKAGDHKAKQKLIESNLRFVVKIAKSYRNQGLSFMDLVQEGNLGLIESIDKFDVTLGFRLTTYCGWWIKLAIQRAVEQKAWPVKIPVNKFETLKRIRSFTALMQQKHGRNPDTREIAAHLKMPEWKVLEIQRAETSFCSLDSSLQEGLPPLSACLPDDRIEAPHQKLLREEMEIRMLKAMEVLNPREKKVLQWRFGLNGKAEPASLRSIGRWIGLSAEGVRRIEEQALGKLRRPVILQRVEGFI